MQLFVKRSDGRTSVVEVEPDTTVQSLRSRIVEIEGVDHCDLKLAFAGKHLQDYQHVCDHRITDGATIYSTFRLRGGAAEKAKREAELKAYRDAMEKEFQNWFTVADQTETTGVMRVLCVSMTLQKDKEEIHGPEEDWGGTSKYSSEPDAEFYDKDDPDNPDNPMGTGYEFQDDFDDTFSGQIFETFGEHFTCMTESKGIVSEDGDVSGTKYYTYKIGQFSQFYEGREPKMQDGSAFEDEGNTGVMHNVKLICASEREGLWYKGPKRIEAPDGKAIWDYEESCDDAGIWCKSVGCTKDPWRIGGKYANIERWLFEGVGTTTFQLDARGKLKLWSQDDLVGELGLTDGERRRLADRVKLTAKSLLKDEDAQKLDFQEKNLDEEVKLCVEEGPCHNPQFKIFQWRIKSLKKLMSNKCVFWTNTEDKVPSGSVVDKTKTNFDDPDRTGAGKEVLQFWKYKKKIGILRKEHVIQDRQRLLDQLEIFTPTYKAIIKRAGQDADGDGGSDHYMVEDYQQKITNIVALALDTHMPDYEEDKIACMIKTLMEVRMGPTWHVLVGRSFGFSVQCEARHFLHLYMQHLAVVVWKSEPDPNAGKGKAKAPALLGAPGADPQGGQAQEGQAEPPQPNGQAAEPAAAAAQ